MTIKSSKTLVEEALKQIKTIDSDEAKKLADQKKCILIDIRDIREIWNEGAISEAIHIPRGMLEFWLDPASPYYKKEKFEDPTKQMLLFCAGGMRSALGAKSVSDMGYKNIAHIDGGFQAMKMSGFEIIEKTKD
tara:strand:+ start:4382 stop:4783 length:402 start_codon:yes stop_codon:yes gene_type:complete